MNKIQVLVTGSAGFIEFHVTRRLLDEGDAVVGVDNINDYYDPALKYGGLEECGVISDAAADGVSVQFNKKSITETTTT